MHLRHSLLSPRRGVAPFQLKCTSAQTDCSEDVARCDEIHCDGHYSNADLFRQMYNINQRLLCRTFARDKSAQLGLLKIHFKYIVIFASKLNSCFIIAFFFSMYVVRDISLIVGQNITLSFSLYKL